MIGIIDYSAGNLTSVARALSYFGYKWIISSDISELKKAERIIFPGVGAAQSAMESLKKFGLDEFLKETFSKGIPILGICLGTQIIFEESEEDGGTKTLGILKGKVVRFPDPLLFKGEKLKVPHMGWNSVIVGDSERKKNSLFSGVKQGSYFYFAHSYYCTVGPYTGGITNYGIDFSSFVRKDNIMAVQFHPEKSQDKGLRILRNFCNL